MNKILLLPLLFSIFGILLLSGCVKKDDAKVVPFNKKISKTSNNNTTNTQKDINVNEEETEQEIEKELSSMDDFNDENEEDLIE